MCRGECVLFFLPVIVGDDARRGSPGAQRLQEKTRLCSGDIWGLAGGKVLSGYLGSLSHFPTTDSTLHIKVRRCVCVVSDKCC